LAGYMGKIKRVAFSKYRAEDVVINGGAAVRAWHANNKIVDIDDVFVAI